MIAFLIDEMFPATTARTLHNKHGYDAVHVSDLGLQGAPDSEVAAAARASDRAVVTENVVDYAAEHDLVLVFVLKRNLPAGGRLGPALAKILHDWARTNPRPYLEPHWPQ